MTNPSHTMRKLAAGLAKLSVEERAALIEQFADELAVQHSQQNNQFQIALGRAELDWRADLDNLTAKMEALITAVVANRNEADAQRGEIMAKLDGVRVALEGLQARPPCMHPDISRAQLEAQAGDDAG